MADVLRIAQYYSYLLDWRQFLVTLFFVMLSILVGVIFTRSVSLLSLCASAGAGSCSFSPWASAQPW